MSQHRYKNIVIIGAGFGGMAVAKRLARHARRHNVKITLINKTNFFLFTPLLHETASGSLTAHNITEPIRHAFTSSQVDFKLGEVKRVDREQKTVTLLSGESMHYDWLVIATGSETDFRNVPGAKEYSFSLKTLEDARVIRSQVISSIEKAIAEKDESRKQALLNFVIIGGGPTGVELAAELSEFIAQMETRDFSNHLCKNEGKVTLVQSGDGLIPQFTYKMQLFAAQSLRQHGVKLLFNTKVTEVTDTSVTLSNGSTLATHTVIWVAGVKPVIPTMSSLLEQDNVGRIKVNSFLQSNSDANIFVIGDAASLAMENQKPMPMLAQVAQQQGMVVADNIVNTLTGSELAAFHWEENVYMLSLGKRNAIVELFDTNLSGFVAWWLWRTVYLFNFQSWVKRFKVVFEWTLELFSRRDTTLLE